MSRNVNPACAGMILDALLAVARMLGKPRVCGDDPTIQLSYHHHVK